MTNSEPVVIVPREESQAKLDLRAVIASRHRVSQTYTITDRIEEAAERYAEQPFLYYGHQCYSYEQMNEQINRTAYAAYENGVRPGDVVALCLENRPGFFFVWLGLTKAGAIVTFLNTNTTGKALVHAVEAANAKVIVVGEECLANFDGVDTRDLAGYWLWSDPERPADGARRALCSLDLSAAAQDAPSGNPPAQWRAGLNGATPAVYIFTSGTTGLPKAAVVSHARWLITGDVMQGSMATVSSDCFYCFLPLYHGAASLSAVATAFSSGGSLALRRKFSRSEFWQDVRRYRVTICQYVGEICRFLLTEPQRDDDKSHTLRKMVGAGLTAETWQKFVERFGDMDIYEGWGATEANANTINLDNRVGSCGRIPFWEKTNLRIVRYDIESDSHLRDDQGYLVQAQPGEVGEAIGMILDVPEMMAGRFEGYTSKEASEKKILRNVFRQGDAWWSSGDLLRFDSDGYCYFVDRIGDTFRWKSENVSTIEVVDSLNDYAGLETITVYGVQVPGHEGRAGMAAIVMRSGHDFDPRTFYDLVEKRLPSYAAPLFLRLSAISDMTSTFKLRKVDLQRDGYDPAVVHEPLFVRDDAARRYVPLTPEAMARALGEPLATAGGEGRTAPFLNYPFLPPAPGGQVVEVAPGILWARMPMQMSLDHINVYLLHDGDGWIVIDTGVNSDTVHALWQSVFKEHLGGLPLKAVLCTHYHFDHAGSAYWLTEQYDVPLFMTHGEFYMLQMAATPMSDPLPRVHKDFFIRSGMPEHIMREMVGAMRSDVWVAPAVMAFRRLRDGDEMRIGTRDWKVIVGEGHAPEHACLYSSKDGILIAGDQLLPRISSNVSVSCLEPEANPMQLWLDSLDRLDALPSDTLVLPSHQQVYHGLHTRVVELREHHHRQFDLVRKAFSASKAYTAFEIMKIMFPKLPHAVDTMLALGETIAHLTWLRYSGELRRFLDEDGIYRFQRASSTATEAGKQ